MQGLQFHLLGPTPRAKYKTNYGELLGGHTIFFSVRLLKNLSLFINLSFKF